MYHQVYHQRYAMKIKNGLQKKAIFKSQSIRQTPTGLGADKTHIRVAA